MHPVLVVDPGVDLDGVVREANAKLKDPQRIRRALVWPEPELPRTEGTRKLKRAAIREWVKSGAAPPPAPSGSARTAPPGARAPRRKEASRGQGGGGRVGGEAPAGPPRPAQSGSDRIAALVAKYAG